MDAPAEPVTLPDAAAWHLWLRQNHTSSPGIWLVLAKQGAAAPPTALARAEALLEALCFGWIDGQAKSRDEATYVQRFTPRRRRSIWSQRNVGYIEQLIAEGRMQPAGLAEVEAAKTDGRWAAAYAGPAQMTVPEELALALAQSPRAQAMFDILTSQNRFALCFRLNNLKTAKGRAKRVADTIAMLERGETPYPQRKALDD